MLVEFLQLRYAWLPSHLVLPLGPCSGAVFGGNRGKRERTQGAEGNMNEMAPLLLLLLWLPSATSLLCALEQCKEAGVGGLLGADDDCCAVLGGGHCPDGYRMSLSNPNPFGPADCVWNAGTCCTPEECANTDPGWCTSPASGGGFDCWAGSIVEPCSCSKGQWNPARMPPSLSLFCRQSVVTQSTLAHITLLSDSPARVRLLLRFSQAAHV